MIAVHWTSWLDCPMQHPVTIPTTPLVKARHETLSASYGCSLPCKYLPFSLLRNTTKTREITVTNRKKCVYFFPGRRRRWKFSFVRKLFRWLHQRSDTIPKTSGRDYLQFTKGSTTGQSWQFVAWFMSLLFWRLCVWECLSCTVTNW